MACDLWRVPWQLVESVEDRVKNVQRLEARAQQRLDAEKSSKAALQQQYDKLVEKQRKYFKLVKDFQVACQRSERLEKQRAQ